TGTVKVRDHGRATVRTGRPRMGPADAPRTLVASCLPAHGTVEDRALGRLGGEPSVSEVRRTGSSPPGALAKHECGLPSLTLRTKALVISPIRATTLFNVLSPVMCQ